MKHSLTLHQVDSRIIIDTYAWNRFNPNRQVSLSTLSQSRAPRQDANDDDRSDDEYTDYEDDELGGEIADEINQLGKARPQALTKEQLLLCSATLKGYSLKNKKWCKWRRTLALLERRANGESSDILHYFCW